MASSWRLPYPSNHHVIHRTLVPRFVSDRLDRDACSTGLSSYMSVWYQAMPEYFAGDHPATPSSCRLKTRARDLVVMAVR